MKYFIFTIDSSITLYIIFLSWFKYDLEILDSVLITVTTIMLFLLTYMRFKDYENND